MTTWFNVGETTDVAVSVKVSDNMRGLGGTSTWTETMDEVRLSTVVGDAVIKVVVQVFPLMVSE